MVSLSTILLLVSCKNEPDIEAYRALLGSWKRFDQQLQNDDLEQTTADLLLLDLAVQEPQFAAKLCQKVKSEQAREKCKQVIGRPHLQQKE